MVSKHSRKIEALLKYAIVLVLIILINLLSRDTFFRWDLTQEKKVYNIRGNKIFISESGR